MIVSLLISIIIGEKIIKKLQKKQVGEIIRDLDLAGQMQKKGTPTMGGIIIILSLLVPCLLFCDMSNIYIILLFVTTLWMGMIGFIVVQSLTDIFGHGAELGAWFNRMSGELIADQRAFWILCLLILVFKGAGPLSLDRLFRSAP